ncbi:MAG: cupin domain-containing protein [Promethearchaeota archaeon]
MKDFLSDLKFVSGKPALKRIVKSKKKFNIVRVCLEKGVEIEPHPEPYAVFFLVLEGSGIFTNKAGEFELKKNDFIFIEADEIRGINCLENLIVLGVQDGH